MSTLKQTAIAVAATSAVTALAFMAASLAPAIAAPAASGDLKIVAAAPDATPVAARKAQRRNSPSASRRLAGKGGGVKDTCPASNKACIKELVANCDKAGGGLSTWEDGSVDCYVVGIHDQP